MRLHYRWAKSVPAEQAHLPAGVGPRRRMALTLASLLAFGVLIALTATSAQAATSHAFTTAFGSATSTPADPVPLSNPTDIAVDNSSGASAHDVYVTDPGVDEQQAITITATGGTYRLTFRGQTTGQLTPSAGAGAVTTALEALSTIGAGNVSVTEPNGSAELVVTFRGTLGSTDVEQITIEASELTGGTATIVTTVPGVPGAAVEKFTPAGEFLLIFGKGVNKAALANPLSSEVEENVCDAGEECQPGTPGTSPGAFEDPAYLAVDPSNGPSAGDIYVVDPTTHLVQKFDPSGNIVSSWGVAGQKDGSDTGATADFGSLSGVAVSAAGRLYVLGGDVPSVEGLSQVYEFEQNGNHFATVTPSGSSTIVLNEPGIAVDQAGNLYIGGARRVQKTDPNGKWDAMITPEVLGIAGFAIDPSGDELYQNTGSVIDRYRADCDLTDTCEALDSFGAGALSTAEGLAIDSTSHAVFVANSGSGEVAVFADVRPQATTGPLFGGTQTSVTVTAHVDPAGHGPITTCEFEYGRETSYGSSVPCSPDPASSPPGSNYFTEAKDVTATITGLPVGFRGHYRVAVSNSAGGTAAGADESFTAAEAPSIDGLEAANLAPTSVELIARVNPDDLPSSYRFEYGTTTAYGQTAPASEVSIESELGRVHAVKVQLNDLTPSVVYHYRLTTENAEGAATSEDHTFDFYPPACPNATLRQQTGSAALPDCRAYELVSPANSGTALIFPSDAPPSAGLATSPARLAYGTWGGIAAGETAEPVNDLGDLYVATRTDHGWVSKYIGLSSQETPNMGSPPWSINPSYCEPDKFNRGALADPDLSKVVDWNDGEWETTKTHFNCYEVAPTSSSEAPYVWDSTSGESIGRWPTTLNEVEGAEAFKGQTAASADLTHFVFSSSVPFPVREEEETAAVIGAIYDNDTQTGTMAVVSLNAAGNNIKGVPGKVSANGSHILIGTPVPPCNLQPGGFACPAPLSLPAHLYMRVDDALTYEIAPGRTVSYVGMTENGSKVYFTSAEQLTSDDHDTSVDLYMWSQAGAEAGQPLTLVSKGDNEGKTGEPGNTDACTPALEEPQLGSPEEEVPWTSKCDVVALSFAAYSELQGGLGGNGETDSAVAAESGDIYFYSPEQLDGVKGVSGLENLYLYRNNSLQYVTTLTPGRLCTTDQGERCGKGPISRMDVSPDGTHMSFVTGSQVTSYENIDPHGRCEGGSSSHCTEMYSYAPATGRITCDSCRPDGLPPRSDVFASENGLFMTDDGRAFFSTSEALVPVDTNQAEDVYEFVEGQPQLISGGTTPGTGSEFEGFLGTEAVPGLVSVSANGTDAYFATTEVLVPQDENGEEIKIYDARTDGGIPFDAPPTPCAAADECHGPGSSQPPSPPDGTGASLGGGGNLGSEPRPKHHKKKSRPEHHKKKAKRRHRRPTAKRPHRAAQPDQGAAR